MGIRLNKLAVAGATTAIVLVSGAAYAAMGIGTNGVIYSCVNSTTGAVRMIDPATTTTCASTEKALNWNQQGRTGPTGYPGPKGEKGDPGPAGDSKKQWARMSADGRILATNNTGAQGYDIRSSGHSAYIYFPGYDTPENCSLTVTPVLTDWSRQVIAVRVPYTGGYWARFNTTEAGRVVAVPVDVVLHC